MCVKHCTPVPVRCRRQEILQVKLRRTPVASDVDVAQVRACLHALHCMCLRACMRSARALLKPVIHATHLLACSSGLSLACCSRMPRCATRTRLPPTRTPKLPHLTHTHCLLTAGKPHMQLHGCGPGRLGARGRAGSLGRGYAGATGGHM